MADSDQVHIDAVSRQPADCLELALLVVVCNAVRARRSGMEATVHG